MEAFCFKCRAKREMSGVQINMSANRNRTAHGVCPQCGGKLVRLMGRVPSVKGGKADVSQSYEELKEQTEDVVTEGDGGRDGDGEAQDPQNGHTKQTPARSGDGRGSRFTTSLGEANVVAFIPKELRTTSTLLQVAKLATEREWGWPEMEIGDWLDTFLFHAMRQRGIILGGYQVLPKKEEEVQNAG